MIARRSQQFTTERWTGHWGADARYWARRSDGACFSIDGAVAVFDLAHSAPSPTLARPVTSIPDAGRYDLRVVATRRDGTTPSDAHEGGRRLMVCGIRRPTRR